MHELSTTVVKVDIKVINASLTENQCLQLRKAALNACRDTATARRCSVGLNFLMF